MPQEKDRKRLVRQRMAETGDPYTQALQALLDDDPRRDLPDERLKWIDLLGSPQHNSGALESLKALPPAELRVVAIDGLQHPDSNVRRRCCRLLDDLTLTDESIAALTTALDDRDPNVRAEALHSLACVQCKPDGCALDERALLERGARDPSPVVRSAVFGPLEWRWDLVQPWVIALLEDALLRETSPKVRGSAVKAIERIRDQLARDMEWRQLVEPLRSTVGRHASKWVVVSDDRVISAHTQRGQAAKQARGARHTRRSDPGTGLEGAQLYWVAPTNEQPPSVSPLGPERESALPKM